MGFSLRVGAVGGGDLSDGLGGFLGTFCEKYRAYDCKFEKICYIVAIYAY